MNKYDSKRWLFLALCILINVCAGIIYAWSVFQKPLVALINASPAEVSLSFTLMLSMGSFMPIVVGKAMDYVSPRQVLFAGGLLFGGGMLGLSFTNSLLQLYVFASLVGLGVATVYPGGTVSNMVAFFPDKRGLASGLLTGGASLGALMWAPAAVALMASYDVLTAFRWIGAIGLTVICLSSLIVERAPRDYRPAGKAVGATQQKPAVAVLDVNWSGMLKSPLFYLVAGVFLAAGTSGMMIIGYVSPIVQDVLKLTPQAAASVVMLLSVANTAGRLAWGVISDRLGRFPVIGLLLVVGAAAMTGLSLAATYFSVVAMIMVIGFYYGGFLSIMAPVTAELFGAKNLGINFGVMFLTIGVGAFVGPRLAAVVKAASDGYGQAFVIAAMLNVAALALLAGAVYCKKRLDARRVVLEV